MNNNIHEPSPVQFVVQNPLSNLTILRSGIMSKYFMYRKKYKCGVAALLGDHFEHLLDYHVRQVCLYCKNHSILPEDPDIEKEVWIFCPLIRPFNVIDITNI